MNASSDFNFHRFLVSLIFCLPFSTFIPSPLDPEVPLRKALCRAPPCFLPLSHHKVVGQVGRQVLVQAFQPRPNVLAFATPRRLKPNRHHLGNGREIYENKGQGCRERRAGGGSASQHKEKNTQRAYMLKPHHLPLPAQVYLLELDSNQQNSVGLS